MEREISSPKFLFRYRSTKTSDDAGTLSAIFLALRENNMASKQAVEKFVNAQQSIQFYGKVRKAFKDVLINLSDKEFELATSNLVLVVIHEGALAQVMHFPAKPNFEVMQITFPKEIPIDILRFVVAHELGHVMQKRNWRKSDGQKLEVDADRFASKIGFPKTDKIRDWIDKHSEFFKQRRAKKTTDNNEYPVP